MIGRSASRTEERAVSMTRAEAAALASMRDLDSAGISTTQQLNVDWSKFENHTFFGCAEANVNIALDKILNSYPYDGTRAQVDDFISKLTGFERWVLSVMPSWTGHANFSSSWVTVQDSAGSVVPTSPGPDSGASKLSPETGSFTVELLLRPASAAAQIIAQHSGSAARWTAYVSASQVSVQSCSVGLSVETQSGSVGVTCDAQLGAFSSVCFVLDASDALARCSAIINGRVIAVSSGSLIGSVSTSGSALIIGSGSSFVAYGQVITPTQTLTASVDEFRFWRCARESSSVARDAARPIYAQPDLALYLKFNEPPPPLATSSPSQIEQIVLDSSGNALHGILTGSASLVRASSSLDDGTLAGERSSTSPVLFPEYPALLTLRSELISSASRYDSVNPNMILRLIPPHFLREAEELDGLTETSRVMSRRSDSSASVGGSRVSSAHLTLSLLYTIARFFDELKIATDAFACIDDADFNEFDTVSDSFIESALERRGFYVPAGLFSDASVDQYIVGDDISAAPASPARSVRASLLRRFLTAAPEIIASKGTISSVESALRSFGVDPHGVMKLREVADDSTIVLADVSETAHVACSFINVSGSMIIRSEPLSGSRTETGWPHPAGAMVNADAVNINGVSNNRNDGLYTSGSWSMIMTAHWPSGSLLVTQSLLRLVSTGSSGRFCTANITAVTDGDGAATITAYSAESIASGSGFNSLSLSGVQLFDGSPWRIGLISKRSDDATKTAASGSMTLVAASGDTLLISSSYCSKAAQSLWTTVTGSHNASGSMIETGGGASLAIMSGALNDPSAPDQARCVSGLFGARQVQFWSTALDTADIAHQANDATSFGSRDPLVSSDAASQAITGSFQKLRMSVASRLHAIDRASDSTGTVTLYDDTRFMRHMTVSGARQSADCGYASVVTQVRVPSQYDIDASSDRVRVADDRSVSKAAKRRTVKFSAEMSLTDALSRALLDAMSTTDALATAIGYPNAAWSYDYPDVERLRDTLCARIIEKLDFGGYMTANRWLESAVGALIRQLVPVTVSFDGVSFVVEPHALERSKVALLPPDHYSTLDTPVRRSESLYLQQVVGTVTR